MSQGFQDIFGGSSSQSQFGSSPSNLQNGAYTNLAPSIANTLSNLFSTGGPSYLGPNSALGASIFNPASGYTAGNNPLVAPLTAGQQGLVAQGTAQGAPTPQLNASQNYISQLLDPNFAANLATSPQTGAAVSAAVNPLINAFNTTTIPGLAGQFTQAGQKVNGPGPETGSSAYNKAAGVAETGLGQNIAATSAGIENQAYQTGLGLQASAPGMAASLSSTELNNTINSLSAAALPQMIQQYGINQGLALFQQRIQTLLQSVGLGGQVSQPVVASTTSGSSSGSSTPGVIGDMNGTLGALMSDRRMKENIERIGMADNGLPIYSFRYLGDNATHIGFMADEVEKVHPAAVIARPDGVKMVDYAIATKPV